MFCAQITFDNTLRTSSRGLFGPPSDISWGPKQPPGLMYLKYCKNVIGPQNMLICFRLHYLYTCQGGGLMPLKLIS